MSKGGWGPRPGRVEFVAPSVECGVTLSMEKRIRRDRVFRGERLSMDEPSAEGFELVDLRVGTCSQFEKLPTAPTPCAAYAASRGGKAWTLDTAEPGTPIVIVVRNVAPDGRPRAFFARIEGTEIGLEDPGRFFGPN